MANFIMEIVPRSRRSWSVSSSSCKTTQSRAEFISAATPELAASRSRTEREAVIVVDKNNAAAGKVRLNYLVDAASWRPQYKLRAGKEEKDAVQVEYLAAVTQQTGEEWNNVDLTLSTAQPMLNAAPPELERLEVSVTPRAGRATPASFSRSNGGSINPFGYPPGQPVGQLGNSSPYSMNQGGGYGQPGPGYPSKPMPAS